MFNTYDCNLFANDETGSIDALKVQTVKIYISPDAILLISLI